MKTKVIASHTSGQGDSWWYLIQKDDGTLHVRHESEHKGERPTEREIPLNDFIRDGAGAHAEVQNLIDRMFEGA